MLRRIPKTSNEQLSPHFNSSEFMCPCGDCKETLIDTNLIAKLEKMRNKTGKLAITSGYRCAAYQKQLRLRGYETAKGVSQHELGRACDVSNGVAPGAELEGYAREAGFTSVGVGKAFIHIDLRSDERRWFYSKR